MIDQTEHERIAKEGELEKLAEEIRRSGSSENNMLEAGKILLAGYAGYLVGRLTSNKSLAYALTGVLSFSSGFLGRGCEFRENEYSMDNVEVVSINIGTGVSGEKKRKFLKFDNIQPVLFKTNGEGKLEHLIEVNEVITDVKTKEVTMCCTEYELKKARNVMIRVD